MITSVRFNKDFRCFKEGETFEFRPLTLLVGDQGVGKSSLIQCIRDRIRYKDRGCGKTITAETDRQTQTLAFDFEKDSSRVKQRIECAQDIHVLFSSHGEVVNATINAVMKNDIPHTTFIMDEPDMALSIRSIVTLCELFTKMLDEGHQIITSVHNPLLIQSFAECFNLGIKEWQTPSVFFQYMGVCDNVLLKC